MTAFRWLVLMSFLWMSVPLHAHPLRLSLCEVDYSSEKQQLSVTLRLFLTDVNEAIVFDPYSEELAFCQSNESVQADQMLLDYLNRFFYIEVNGKRLALQLKGMDLKGEGDNTALWLYFVYPQSSPLKSIEIKNAIFTDLFFDQNNIVYIHADEESESLMLDKQTPVHQLTF